MARKILIADDEPMLTGVLSEHLKREGYTTLVAENGREVMDKLALWPDLILLDINMPGMDGLELCRAIRDAVSCPILFLTARIREQDKIRGLQARGDSKVVKEHIRKIRQKLLEVTGREFIETIWGMGYRWKK